MSQNSIPVRLLWTITKRYNFFLFSMFSVVCKFVHIPCVFKYTHILTEVFTAVHIFSVHEDIYFQHRMVDFSHTRYIPIYILTIPTNFSSWPLLRIALLFTTLTIAWYHVACTQPSTYVCVCAVQSIYTCKYEDILKNYVQ